MNWSRLTATLWRFTRPRCIGEDKVEGERRSSPRKIIIWEILYLDIYFENDHYKTHLPKVLFIVEFVNICFFHVYNEIKHTIPVQLIFFNIIFMVYFATIFIITLVIPSFFRTKYGIITPPN